MPTEAEHDESAFVSAGIRCQQPNPPVIPPGIMHWSFYVIWLAALATALGAWLSIFWPL
jgi:hypothetical protein